MKSALLLEDHQATAKWLISILRTSFSDIDIDHVLTLAATYKKTASKSYSLAVVDISLPDGSGLDIVKHIAEKFPETYIVVATIFDDDEHIFSALSFGAHGYLLKEDNSDYIAEQLQAIVKGVPPLSPAVARRVLRFFKSNKHVQPEASSTQDSKKSTLTKREIQVLSLIAKGSTRIDVAEILGITPNTASDYVKRIYAKLSINSRAEATLAATRMGLLR